MKTVTFRKTGLGKRTKGFTLIEVVVALVIVATVMSGLIYTVNVETETSFKMYERFQSRNVAWNRLMSQYQLLQRWTPQSGTLGERNGEQTILGTEWYWELEVEETLGENFFRYEVKSYRDARRQGASSGSLAAFFIAE